MFMYIYKLCNKKINFLNIKHFEACPRGVTLNRNGQCSDGTSASLVGQECTNDADCGRNYCMDKTLHMTCSCKSKFSKFLF